MIHTAFAGTVYQEHLSRAMNRPTKVRTVKAPTTASAPLGNPLAALWHTLTAPVAHAVQRRQAWS
jgi:hypothetical protein